MHLINKSNSLREKLTFGLALVILVGLLPIISNVKNGAVVNSESTCDWTMLGKSADGNRVVYQECAPDIQKLDQQWSLDGCPSTPVIWGDRMYCARNDVVTCVNSQSGATIWTSEVLGYVSMPPAVVDGKIYFSNNVASGDASRLFCLDALTGKEIWRIQTQKAVYYFKVWGNQLFYIDGKTLICVDVLSKKTLWTHDNYSQDFIISNGGVFLSGLKCLDADTGGIVWESKEKLYGKMCISSGNLYITQFSSSKYFISCIAPDSGEVLWESEIGDYNKLYDIKTAVSGDKILISSTGFNQDHKNVVICFDIKSKKQLWEQDFGEEKIGQITIIGGNIALGTNTGKLIILSGETGKTIRQIDFDGMIDWEIVAAQERVYVHANYAIYCLGVTSHITKPAGWLMAGGNSQGNRFSPDGAKTKIVKPFWTFETSAPVTSSAAIQKDKAVFGSDDGNVYCVNTGTGDKLWSFKIGDRVQTCPAIWLGKVLIGSNDGKMYCLSLQTGKELWEFDAKASIRSSPVVSDGMVFFGTDGKMIYCLDIENGNKRWEIETGNPVTCPLAVETGKVFATFLEVEKDNHNFSRNFWALHCLDSKTGEVIWNFEVANGTDSPATVSDGKVFVATLDKKILCIDEETGIKDWDVQIDTAVTTTISTDYSRIFFGTCDKTVHCLNRDNGATCWETMQDGNLNSNPALCDKFIYFGTSHGKIISLDKNSGQMEWTIETGSAVTSSPSICDGKVYAGSWDGKLYCIGDTEEKIEPPSANDWLSFGRTNQNNRVVPEDAAPKTNNLKQLWANSGIGSNNKIITGRYIFAFNYNQLIKIDALSGAIIWKKGYNWDFNSFSANYILLDIGSNDRLVLRGKDSKQLFCVSIIDGCILWSYDDTSDAKFTTAEIIGDKVFSVSGKLNCFDLVSGKLLWQSDDVGAIVASSDKLYISFADRKSHWLACVDPTTGKRLWMKNQYEWMGGEMALVDGRLFGSVKNGSQDWASHTFYCIDASTGEKVWETEISSHASGTPAVANGRIYLGANGFIYILDEATGGFIDKFPYLSTDTSDGSNLIWSGGRLFWRSYKGQMCCMDATSGKVLFTIKDPNNYNYSNSIIHPVLVGFGRIYCMFSIGLTCWGDDISTQGCDWSASGRDNSRNGNASLPCPQDQVKAHQVWQFDSGVDIKTSGAGETTPVMANGCLYFYSRNHKFWSIDAKTGKANWSYELDKEQECYMPAVYGDGKVYFVSFSKSRLYCLDSANGRKLWDFDVGNECRAIPVFYEGKVYMGALDRNEYCLDGNTGKVVWSFACKGQAYGSPAIVDGQLFFGTSDVYFVCLDALTGKLIWEYCVGEPSGSSVIVSGGKVYFSSGDRQFNCLDKFTGMCIWKKEMESTISEGLSIVGNRIYINLRGKFVCLDANTQKELWSSASYTYGGAPCVVRDKVYIGNDDGNFDCLNAYTGQVIWQVEGFRGIRSDVIWQDGKLYFSSYNGIVYCYEEEN